MESPSRVNRVPLYERDLFAREALQNPFPHYAAIRELGAVVRLPNPNVLAISRYEDVRRALHAAEILISGKGIGFNDFLNQPTPEPGLLTSDGERHLKLKLPLMRQLSPAALKPMREMLRKMIGEQVSRFANGGTFDGVAELAAHLPVGVVSKLVGLPENDRAKMLRWASASFNVVGPLERDGEIAPEFLDDLATATEVRDYLAQLDPRTLRPGSWAAQLFDAVASGGMSVGDARSNVRAFVLPSLDTTIYASSNLLYNLGRNPDQYEMLRKEPALLPSAVLEGVRLSAVVRWFSRVAVEDYVAGDVFVPRGERVMLLYGSANRDPRHYENPDAFDVRRRPADQLGWGSGPHVCAGMHLAKLEMEVLLEALVEGVERIEVDEPELGSNNGLYGIDKLPIRLFSA